MKHVLLSATVLALLSGAASAATLTLPSVTIVGAPSTAISCAPYPANPSGLAGTVLTTCTVAPAGWSGAVSLSGSQFVVTGLVGTTFNVAVGASPLPAGTYQPGVLTSMP